jgi:tetratricopeptide (TPR) repeat protein
LNEFDQAHACYDRILEIDPLQADCMVRKAALFLIEKRGDEAIELLNRALRIDKNNLLILRYIAYAYYLIGDESSAVDYLRRANGVFI